MGEVLCLVLPHCIFEMKEKQLHADQVSSKVRSNLVRFFILLVKCTLNQNR